MRAYAKEEEIYQLGAESRKRRVEVFGHDLRELMMKSHEIFQVLEVGFES